VFAPTSPIPRPASSAAKAAATRTMTGRSAGRTPAAVVMRANVAVPSSVPGMWRSGPLR